MAPSFYFELDPLLHLEANLTLLFTRLLRFCFAAPFLSVALTVVVGVRSLPVSFDVPILFYIALPMRLCFAAPIPFLLLNV